MAITKTNDTFGNNPCGEPALMSGTKRSHGTLRGRRITQKMDATAVGESSISRQPREPDTLELRKLAHYAAHRPASAQVITVRDEAGESFDAGVSRTRGKSHSGRRYRRQPAPQFFAGKQGVADTGSDTLTSACPAANRADICAMLRP